MPGHGEERLDTSKKPRSRKKPYSAPKLTAHGDVEQITKSTGGINTDGLLGSTQIPV